MNFEPSFVIGLELRAPLKNNYDPQRRLVRSEKLLQTLGGALFREAPSN